ncbi:Uncharacterised protein [Burkholderia pseudomallei]|nr:hypothetical protein BIM11_5380 [Burkholderia pseudomallei]CAJ3198553.1 Uncharacterised protein [Burkholderia pseudomallei]CAJ3246744.1 Uncharacterised protein [Burkholderia pseudomallei]CAJ3256598.1 Uncharacterised protein [Burkholderia pseudomallei]CAJ3277172.1 Uncharacterised protein [Burkholderia pseudomallei]
MRIADRVSRVRIDGGLPAAQAAGAAWAARARRRACTRSAWVECRRTRRAVMAGRRARCSPDGRHLPGRIRDIGASGAVRHARRTRPVARRVPTPGRAAQPAGGRSPSCRSNRALSHSMNTRTLCGRLRFGRGRIDTGRAGSSKRLVEAARHASQRARARVRLDEVSRCLPQAETGEHRRDIRVRIVDRHGALHRDGLRLAVVDEAPYPRLAGVHRRVVDADVAVERIERLGHAVALQIRGRRARARRHRADTARDETRILERADPHHAIDALPTGSMSRSVSRKRRRPLRIRGTRADPR